MPYGWGWVWMVVFWVIIILIITAIVRAVSHDKRHYRGGYWRDSRGNTALDILNERYAKGEITKEEFEAKKKDMLG